MRGKIMDEETQLCLEQHVPQINDLSAALVEANDANTELKCVVAKQESIIRIQKAASARWVPCSGHRDKVSVGDECQVCRRERAERALESVLNLVIGFQTGADADNTLFCIKGCVERALNQQRN